jgi:hypothetical protein
LGKLIVQDNYRSIRAIAHVFMKSHQVSENTQKVPEVRGIAHFRNK